jgi:paraquat-inducible protein A
MTRARKAPVFSGRRIVLIALALAYASGAIFASIKIITHTFGSTNAIEKILNLYNVKNEGEKTLDEYKKAHPLLGGLFGGTVQKSLELPSQAKADEALYGEVPHNLRIVRKESHIAAWWSWFLISLSFAYIVTVIACERSFSARGVLFAMTACSVLFFTIGVIAPAMVIWTAPTIPMATGNMEFVVQHQIRGIAAIILDLLKSGHFVIGGFLLLFSIGTPLTKASLTFFVSFSSSEKINARIGSFLHSIGKWSMADVFVAAILLSLYALKFQQATRSIPCLGLYYFIGYCLLSMTTTQLLVHSGAVGARKTGRWQEEEMGIKVVIGLIVAVFCFVSASGLYTYNQYTENTKEKVQASGTPGTLNNSDLVLPGHK